MIHKMKVKCAEKGISLRKMCTELGMCYEGVCHWDEHSPSVHKVAKVAEYLGCSIEDLLND